MEPEGIRVDEIDLNLPGACYYLYWEPCVARNAEEGRRGRRDAIRGIGRRLGWTVYATGVSPEACRMLFGTTTDNLDTGLAALVGSSARHVLYFVHPESALQPAARFIQERGRDGFARRDAGGGGARLPDVHHGLFMGERPWAERMLATLVARSRQAAASTERRRSLAEIAGVTANRRDAIAEAFRAGGYTLKDIAEYFEMHFSEVSAVINTSAVEGQP